MKLLTSIYMIRRIKSGENKTFRCFLIENTRSISGLKPRKFRPFKAKSIHFHTFLVNSRNLLNTKMVNDFTGHGHKHDFHEVHPHHPFSVKRQHKERHDKRTHAECIVWYEVGACQGFSCCQSRRRKHAGVLSTDSPAVSAQLAHVSHAESRAPIHNGQDPNCHEEQRRQKMINRALTDNATNSSRISEAVCPIHLSLHLFPCIVRGRCFYHHF